MNLSSSRPGIDISKVDDVWMMVFAAIQVPSSAFPKGVKHFQRDETSLGIQNPNCFLLHIIRLAQALLKHIYVRLEQIMDSWQRDMNWKAFLYISAIWNFDISLKGFMNRRIDSFRRMIWPLVIKILWNLQRDLSIDQPRETSKF